MAIPKLELDEREAETASYVAMAIRNALEGFHAEHLTDEQMAQLNPILRDAVATALYALAHREEDPRCAAFVMFQRMLIPDYWERPELLPSLTEMGQ